MQHSKSKKPTLPSVVQLGFSGSRELFDGVIIDSPTAAKLCDEVEVWLERRIVKIREELQLEDNQFFVGISQLACGADTVFSKVCRKQSIAQRIFLPEHREHFLNACEPGRAPDFTPKQRAEAKNLLESAHIIQERVVVNATDRSTRFVETNIEIMRFSDAMVCLLRTESNGKAGGTHQLMQRAIQRAIPVLEIQVAEKSGRMEVVVDRWHNRDASPSVPPRNLPESLSCLPFPPLVSGQNPIPLRDEYCDTLSTLATQQAEGKQRLFKTAAGLIIATHIAATVLATTALSMHTVEASHGADATETLGHAQSADSSPTLVLCLLVAEFVLLGVGFAVHNSLHHSHAVREWAMSRVVCELVRSLRAIGSRHLYLEHLFRLHLPHEIRPLLRTLNVLHLHSTWPQRTQPWQPQRDAYIRLRFDDPVHGQLHFFEKALRKDQRLMAVCQSIFVTCSGLAMMATLFKFIALWNHTDEHWILATFGGLAVTLPVLAVGGLSWAAAVDCEARVETFGESLNFLKRQRPYLEQAASGLEFDRLLLETETVLLGEITNWYSRRSNKGVS